MSAYRQADKAAAWRMINVSKPKMEPVHSGMSASRDDVVRLFGHIEDEAIAQILALLPSVAELEEAQAWAVGQGDALARSGRPQTPRITAILDIVADRNEEDEPRSSPTR